MKKPHNHKVSLYLVFIALFLLSFLLDQEIKNFFAQARNPLLDFAFGILTNFGILVAAMLILPLLMLKDNKKIYTLLLAFFFAVFVSVALKWMFLRQRPIEFINPFIKILSYSFPSMHSVVIFALLPLLMDFLHKQRNFWVLFAFVVPFTRLYFGFHYLSDVVFGAVLGYSIGFLLLGLHTKGRLWKAKSH